MKRREFLRNVGLGAASLAAPRWLIGGQPAPAARPNVILILTDDQGYGDLHCHGNPAIHTPNLDRLHGQSVRLTDFHVCPICSPTRAALMTGRDNGRTGVWSTVLGRSLLRRDERTVADVFAASGYRTGIFGKWHLGDNYPYRPHDRGFQEALYHGGGGVGQTPDTWGNDYVDDTYFRNGKPEKFTGYCTDIWFAEAIKFMGNAKRRGGPFFCYIPTNAPHSPYTVPEKYWRMYQTPDGKKKPGVGHAGFSGMITNIDENVGGLMKFLAQEGLERDTILIFMTDNGSSSPVFNAGMRAGKGQYYDGGHRVPFFLRWPGGGLGGVSIPMTRDSGQDGRDVPALCAHIDVLPTLAGLCRLKRPEGGLPLDGKDLTGLLTGQVKPADWPERTIFIQARQTEAPPEPWDAVAITHRWRLIGGKELYDIQADPAQGHDVADRHPDVVRRLRAEQEKWYAQVSQRFGEECSIPLGDPAEEPTRLNCMDWHAWAPWNQGMVRQGQAQNGYWAVEVPCDGTYEFELRRWPAEADLPIRAKGPGKALNITAARLKIGPFDQTQPVGQADKGATFRVKLAAAGKLKLWTWLIGPDKADCGAYYVYVRRRS